MLLNTDTCLLGKLGRVSLYMYTSKFFIIHAFHKSGQMHHFIIAFPVMTGCLPRSHCYCQHVCYIQRGWLWVQVTPHASNKFLKGDLIIDLVVLVDLNQTLAKTGLERK